ncbi:NACHT domain-containing NTPase [Cellulomonas sp. B6]|uniref:NACHT domain-containing protein n=1 Tax=Cellulomonas sp. B6 TaxID=1295626 RepID=UPI0009E6CC26|nr:NACHT domain-containing protein [Cellulomonas sp. B6]
MARLYLIEGHGKKAEGLARSVRSEFDAALRLAMASDVDDAVCDAMYAAINEVVLREVEPLLAKPDVAVTLEAEITKTVGSLAAASARNSQLLRGIANIDELYAFEEDYRAQVAGLHATMKLPHAGTTRQVPYRQLFVEPRVRLNEKQAVHRRGDDGLHLSVSQLMLLGTRAVVLGDPGGGKSTLSRKLTYDLAADVPKSGVRRTPFFVELRDYASVVRGKDRTTLVEYLEALCRSPYNIEPPTDAIEWLLLNDRAVVILDGLDELLDTGLRKDVVQAVEGFAHRYPTCPIIVTSRRVGYNEAPLDSILFPSVHLSEFTEAQVQDYVRKWFALDETVDATRQDALAASFMADSTFVADLRINPLMLSLMCGIYASENYIPRNRPDVYEKCALLLFERWDKQRGITAPLSFDAHVQAAMRSLALYMYKIDAEGADAGGIEPGEGIQRDRLVEYMKNYLLEKRFDDEHSAEAAASEFIDFCKGRAWVLTDIGSDTYGFTHRTFLEYFAASQLVRENTSAAALYAQLEPHIRSGGWDVVAQLAVQILGRSTEDGADDFLALVLDSVEGDSAGDYYAASFAVRAMQFVVPRPALVRDCVGKAFGLHVEGAQLMVEARGAVRDDLGQRLLNEMMIVSTENEPRVGAVLRQLLRERLERDETDKAAIAAALAPLYRYSSLVPVSRYWVGWAGENLKEFSSSVSAASRSLRWVAVMEMERGNISVDDLFRWHGVHALYAFREPERWRRMSPPFFYRFLVMRRRGGFDGAIGFASAKVAERLEVDLVDRLSRAQTPWLTARAEQLGWAWLLEPDGGVVLSRVGGVGILLLLPLLEAHDARVSKREPVLLVLADWASTLTVARERGEVTDDARELLEANFPDAEFARAFVERWIRRDLSVVGPRKRKSTDAAAASGRRRRVEPAVAQSAEGAREA